MLLLYAHKLGATDMFIYEDGIISLYRNNNCICYQEDITLRQLLKIIRGVNKMEQILIDANKLKANICKWLKPTVPDESEMVAIDDIGISVLMEIEEQPTVFTIPENPTNGDMIQAIFNIPDSEIDEGLSTTYIYTKTRVLKGGSQDHLKEQITFNREWWNAPYKKGEVSE